MAEKKFACGDWGSLVRPLILIGLGLFFLLSNLGLISWNFWEAVGRLWPIFLIAMGLDLLIGRRSLLASLAVVGATAVLPLVGLLWLGGAGDQRGVVVEEVWQPLNGADSGQATIIFGVGGLQLSALPAQSPALIAGALKRSERGERIEQSFTARDGVALYALQSRGPSNPFGFLNPQLQNLGWDLQLNRDMPLDLTVRTGVGESSLDLRHLNLSALRVTSGVGQTTVTLPGYNQYTAVIEGGVGELTVLLPPETAVRIQVETGLGGVSVLGNSTQTGNVYLSAGFDTAADGIELQLKAGVGQVTVREYGHGR